MPSAVENYILHLRITCWHDAWPWYRNLTMGSQVTMCLELPIMSRVLLDPRCHKVRRLNSSPSWVRNGTLEIKSKWQQRAQTSCVSRWPKPQVTSNGCTRCSFMSKFPMNSWRKEKNPSLIYGWAGSVHGYELKLDNSEQCCLITAERKIFLMGKGANGEPGHPLFVKGEVTWREKTYRYLDIC